jgi:hypothetical protein
MSSFLAKCRPEECSLPPDFSFSAFQFFSISALGLQFLLSAFDHRLLTPDLPPGCKPAGLEADLCPLILQFQHISFSAFAFSLVPSSVVSRPISAFCFPNLSFCLCVGRKRLRIPAA